MAAFNLIQCMGILIFCRRATIGARFPDVGLPSDGYSEIKVAPFLGASFNDRILTSSHGLNILVLRSRIGLKCLPLPVHKVKSCSAAVAATMAPPALSPCERAYSSM